MGLWKRGAETGMGWKKHLEGDGESEKDDLSPQLAMWAGEGARKVSAGLIKKPWGVIYGSGCGRVNGAGRVERIHLSCIWDSPPNGPLCLISPLLHLSPWFPCRAEASTGPANICLHHWKNIHQHQHKSVGKCREVTCTTTEELTQKRPEEKTSWGL